MKTEARLWVRLKVTDLVAQTAWMTLTGKMGFGDDLVGILRYSYWEMDVEGGSPEAVCEAIDREIRMDSTFTNQNKHVYCLTVTAAVGDTAGAAGVSGGSDSAGGDAGRSDAVGGAGGSGAGGGNGDDSPGAVRGARAGDLDIYSDFPRVERGEGVFACDLFVSQRGGGRDEGYASRLNARLEGATVTGMRSGEVWRVLVRADSAEEAARKVEEMAVTRSRRHGLLLNPHYQAYEFIGTTGLAGQ